MTAGLSRPFQLVVAELTLAMDPSEPTICPAPSSLSDLRHLRNYRKGNLAFYTIFFCKKWLRRHNSPKITDFWLSPTGCQLCAFGIPANRPQDTTYPMAEFDRDHQPLTGANTYVIRFPSRRDLPPANGFWSLTMYHAQWF
jgi:hypothetical protein